MKNLCSKAKGKIHPSSGDALSVLTLLPAAILALTAVLGCEDKEVLAYLITRSLNGPWSVAAATEIEKKRCRKCQVSSAAAACAAGVHAPLFDCGCFECYTSFWIRWDSSPDRELIHQVIEAFEEHLASSEKKVKGKVGRRRERKEKEKIKNLEKDKEKEREEEEKRSKDKEAKEEVEEKNELVIETMEVEDQASAVGTLDDNDDGEVEVTSGDVVIGGGGGGGGERRRSWPDAMALFKSRLWSLWSPGI